MGYIVYSAPQVDCHVGLYLKEVAYMTVRDGLLRSYVVCHLGESIIRWSVYKTFPKQRVQYDFVVKPLSKANKPNNSILATDHRVSDCFSGTAN